jgi:hypothetical protein
MTFTVLGTLSLTNLDTMEQMPIITIQTTKFLDMQNYPVYDFLPLRYKYSPQYPFLRHPESRVTYDKAIPVTGRRGSHIF